MAETKPRRRWGRARTHTHTYTGQKPHQTAEATLASATLITRDQVRRVGKKQSWQQEAWSLYEKVAELGFAAQWLGRALSRCRLVVAEPSQQSGSDPVPAKDPGLAGDILARLHEGTGGQGQMLRRMAIHLTVPGETYLVGIEDPDHDPNGDGVRWLVASTSEFSGGNKPRVKLPEDGSSVELDPDTSTIIRIWQPHPERAWEADSSVRYCRGVLREIHGLAQRVQADIDSRLAGAGVLVVPKSATMPNPNQTEGEPLHEDRFVEGLIEAMITPIKDREDSSAVVPIVIKVPDESVSKVQHLSFSTPFDAKTGELLQAAIRRFAGSSDLPAEIITGLGDTNHWGAWAISEQAVRMHVEPMLGCIVQALTAEYLWPALRAAGEPNPERYVIWYDTSELVQRPDRSKESQALYDLGELSAEALLRENGFDPERDAPDDKERIRWMATRLVMAQPSLLPYMAEALGLPAIADQLPDPAAQQQRQTLPGQQRRLQLASQPTGSRNEPPEDQGTVAAAADPQPSPWMISALERDVLRALELAGKRLLGSRGRSGRYRSEPARQVHTWDIHTVVGALDETQVDKVLAGAFELTDQAMPDQPCVRQAVEVYTRALLATGRPHRREYLVDMLWRSGCLTSSA